MKTVYKYPVPLDDMPHRVPGHVVHAEMLDRYSMNVWAEVDTVRTYVGEMYQVYGTGHPLPKNAQHVRTVIDPPFVWHLYAHMVPLKIPQYTTEGAAND